MDEKQGVTTIGLAELLYVINLFWRLYEISIYLFILNILFPAVGGFMIGKWIAQFVYRILGKSPYWKDKLMKRKLK